MDIFGVLVVVGAVAMLLYGMHIMSSGLERISGGKLERYLEKMTGNVYKGIFFGTIVTGITQSSSAITVILVGLVNSGIMKLSQTVGVIMGANIGTTFTAWILSLVGISDEGFIFQMLKPSSFTPIVALIGVILVILGKTAKRQEIGSILMGFALLMFGMQTLTDAVKPLANMPEFQNLFLMFKNNPLTGVLAGAILTAIIQSSTASVGILQALAVSGNISFSAAFAIIMGQNIGTCFTALLSSIGTSKNAKRTAMIHLYYNIFGTIIFLLGFYGLNVVFDFSFADNIVTAADIALIHTVFNVGSAIIFLPMPMVILLEKLAVWSVREGKSKEDDEFRLLDDRFLTTPSYAISQCHTLTVRMAEISKRMITDALSMIHKFNKKSVVEILKQEELTDMYEDKLGTYLLKISAKNLTEKEGATVTMLLHTIGDFERISDHAVNVLEAAQEMKDKELEFSDKAKEEFNIFSRSILEILDRSIQAFRDGDIQIAKSVEPLEEIIDNLNTELRKRHIKRLRKGKCTIELGFILSDLLTNLERVADHCSNIAVSVIQEKEGTIETHEYRSDLRLKQDKEFIKLMEDYNKKYMLP